MTRINWGFVRGDTYVHFFSLIENGISFTRIPYYPEAFRMSGANNDFAFRSALAGGLRNGSVRSSGYIRNGLLAHALLSSVFSFSDPMFTSEYDRGRTLFANLM